MNTDKATQYKQFHATHAVLQKPIQVVILDDVCPKVFLTSPLRILLSGERQENSRRRPTRSTCFLFSTEAPSQPVQQTMIMERLLHRIASCCATADDANQECTRKLEEAVQSCLTTNSINDMGRERMKFLLCFPTQLVVSHGSCIVCDISTLMSWSVLGCRVIVCLTTICVMVSTSCLFSRLNVMFCPADSRPSEPQHI